MYLVEDLIVLTLSLSYIPLRRIAYSLLTVILSGQLIGLVGKEKARRTGCRALNRRRNFDTISQGGENTQLCYVFSLCLASF